MYFSRNMFWRVTHTKNQPALLVDIDEEVTSGKHKMWAAYFCTSQNLFAIDDSFKHRLWIWAALELVNYFET